MELSAPHYVPPPPNYRRMVVFVVVVGVQLAIIWVIQSGLGKMMIDRLKGPLETKIIEEVIKEEDRPPPPPPTFKPPPPVQLDLPVVAITQDAPVTRAIDTNAQAKAAPPPPATKEPVRTPPRADARRTEKYDMDAEYPTMSKRLNEEGVVVLLLTINEQGRVTQAVVKESSGFPRLDEKAVQVVTKYYRYMPGTVDGKPEVSTVIQSLRWKIPK